MQIGQKVQVRLNFKVMPGVIAKLNPKRVWVALEGSNKILVRKHQIQE